MEVYVCIFRRLQFFIRIYFGGGGGKGLFLLKIFEN